MTEEIKYVHIGISELRRGDTVLVKYDQSQHDPKSLQRGVEHAFKPYGVRTILCPKDIDLEIIREADND